MPGGARLLIATGAAAASLDELPPLVRAVVAGASDVLVMTPVLTSALQWLASDTDRARYEADERLGAVLGQVEELAPGAAARAQVGDETPMTAFADAIRQFRPDHIVIALRSDDHSAWQERGLIDGIRTNFHIPITVFELDHAGQVPPGRHLTAAAGPAGRRPPAQPARRYETILIVLPKPVPSGSRTAMCS